MKAYLDIENSRTQKVITICVNIIKYKVDNEIIFDISPLNNKELKLLENAINEKLTYTDIEMFFINNNKTPDFGPDYSYKIIDNKLILTRITKKKAEKIKDELKNKDWTLNYEEDFNIIGKNFLKTNYNYLLIYKDNEFKSKYYKNKPKDSIFMDLFFNKNYKMIALFKRKETNSKNIRDNLEYINSYFEE